MFYKNKDLQHMEIQLILQVLFGKPISNQCFHQFNQEKRYLNWCIQIKIIWPLYYIQIVHNSLVYQRWKKMIKPCTLIRFLIGFKEMKED